jgi:hypothetical protein
VKSGLYRRADHLERFAALAPVEKRSARRSVTDVPRTRVSHFGQK